MPSPTEPAPTTSSTAAATGVGLAQIRYQPGMRVRVTQQVPRQTGTMTTTVEGTVLRFGQQKTGSWFAHARDDRLWLDRLELRLDDGELVVLNLDRYSHVEVVAPPAASSPP